MSGSKVQPRMLRWPMFPGDVSAVTLMECFPARREQGSWRKVRQQAWRKARLPCSCYGPSLRLNGHWHMARSPVAAASAASRGQLLWIVCQDKAQEHFFSKKMLQKVALLTYLRRIRVVFSCLLTCVRDFSLCSCQKRLIFMFFLSQGLPLCNINVIGRHNAVREIAALSPLLKTKYFSFI